MTESAQAYELSNVVETALAKALVLAADTKRWDVVMRIAEELALRRGQVARHSGAPHWQGGRRDAFPGQECLALLSV